MITPLGDPYIQTLAVVTIQVEGQTLCGVYHNSEAVQAKGCQSDNNPLQTQSPLLMSSGM